MKKSKFQSSEKRQKIASHGKHLLQLVLSFTFAIIWLAIISLATVFAFFSYGYSREISLFLAFPISLGAEIASAIFGEDYSLFGGAIIFVSVLLAIIFAWIIMYYLLRIRKNICHSSVLKTFLLFVCVLVLAPIILGICDEFILEQAEIFTITSLAGSRHIVVTPLEQCPELCTGGESGTVTMVGTQKDILANLVTKLKKDDWTIVPQYPNDESRIVVQKFTINAYYSLTITSEAGKIPTENTISFLLMHF